MSCRATTPTTSFRAAPYEVPGDVRRKSRTKRNLHEESGLDSIQMGMSALSVPLWLFVSYGGGHVKALLPVARRVQELGIAKPLYLGLTTAGPAVRQAGVRSIGFKELMTVSDAYARLKGEELFEQLQVQAADRAESVAYLGLSYADLVARLGAVAADDLYRRYGRQAFLPIGVMERLIRTCQPTLVVATNSPRAERAAIEAARIVGVASVCLLDLGGIAERQVLARADYADALCVLNEAVRDSFIHAGRPAEHVWITGNPAFDGINDPASILAGRAYRREAGWENLRVCLYASSPEPVNSPGISSRGDPELPRKIEAALIEQVRANPRLALWVRRHPSEPSADEIQAHPRIRVSDQKMPLHATIHASDEVIVTVSTVGIEAGLAGKPVTQVRGSILDQLSAQLSAVIGLSARTLSIFELADAYGPEAPISILEPALATRAEFAANATDRVVEVLKAMQERHGR